EQVLAILRLPYKQRIDAYRKPVYGLVIFVGIFGIVNLLNMLFSNMATRKREYGMLQCVGLTDKQLSSIVVKEGILYSVGSISISLIFGTIFGIILCNVFSSFSVFGKVIYHFPFKEMTVYFSILIIVQMIFAYIIINFYKRESLIDRIK
ncbi:FtsX-like permease family protein, partial [Blautia massiliensis (ex Durand et al. 2017)]